MSIQPQDTYAAIDLGSNSFHLLVATFHSGQLQQIDKVKQMVRLAANLDTNKHITQNGLDSAYECLSQFAQRIRGIPNQNIKIVGTNTLRVAKNAGEFLQHAEQILDHEIDIISGREEARMLYLGVAQSMSEHLSEKLVMDIGGGSTEIIAGIGFDAHIRESLHMGCVSMTRLYFADGLITAHQWKQAKLHARRELMPVVKAYIEQGWSHAVGSSGTMRAAAKILIANGWSQTGINHSGLQQLKQRCIELGVIEALSQISGLSARRQPVIVGGLVIIEALMEAFQLPHMSVSTGALREGLAYSLAGKKEQIDVTERSIHRLQRQFQVDVSQAKRVSEVLRYLLNRFETTFADKDLFLLESATQLHEIGLSIAHNHFHKHGAYVVQHADLPGFSRQQQLLISHLIRYQRRKLHLPKNPSLSEKQWQRVLPMKLLLRLAIIFCRDRENHHLPSIKLRFDGHSLHVQTELGWLKSHSLIEADLSAEVDYLSTIGIRLGISEL